MERILRKLFFCPQMTSSNEFYVLMWSHHLDMLTVNGWSLSLKDFHHTFTHFYTKTKNNFKSQSSSNNGMNWKKIFKGKYQNITFLKNSTMHISMWMGEWNFKLTHLMRKRKPKKMSALTQNTLVKNCHTLKLWFLVIEIIIYFLFVIVSKLCIYAEYLDI